MKLSGSDEVKNKVQAFLNPLVLQTKEAADN